MCLNFENWGQIDWKSCFWKIWINSRVFEKLFISYSCILFINYYALRSFCIKMLRCSKIWFFQIFDRLNLLLDQSKLWLKIWFESAWLDPCLSDAGSIEYVFQSIEPIFRLIENWSESFLKHELFTCSSLFQKFSKSFSFSLWPIQIHYQFFCYFPSNFSQGFCHLAPVRPFYPFFFCLISFSMHFRDIFEPNNFWRFFDVWDDFFQNCSMGFCYWMM